MSPERRHPSTRAAVLGACLLACSADGSEAREPAPITAVMAPDRSPLVFGYTVGGGEFSYALELRADGRWLRQDHAGTAPEGRLPPATLERFLALVDAALFETKREPCQRSATQHASFRDYRRGRTAQRSSAFDPATGWASCGAEVDPATQQLVPCLEALTVDPTAAEGVCDSPGTAAN